MAYRTRARRLSHLGWSARILISAVLALMTDVSALPQGGLASVNGTVTDQSGAVVVGARVVAINAATGQSRETTTTSNGTYVLPLLPVGVYTVSCTRAGFRSSAHPDV